MLPSEICQLTNLEELYLHNNPQLTVLPKGIKQLPNLKDLSDNNTQRSDSLRGWYLCERVYESERMQ